MIENNYRNIIYEVKYISFIYRGLKNLIFFSSFYCLPFMVINYFYGESIGNISTLLLLLIGIAAIKAIINETKFLYKIEFDNFKISLYYYFFLTDKKIQIDYTYSSIYILYSYPQTINTDYLIIKVAGKRIIKQYRDWGWSTEIFNEIVETYNLYKEKNENIIQ